MFRFIYTVLILFMLQDLKSQPESFASGFSAELIPVMSNSPKVRKAMVPEKTIQKLNPFFYIGSGLMFIYQNVFSEQLQSNCQYHISCSEFAKRSVQRYGIVKGTLMGINQLNSCTPGIYLEYDRHFITNEFKVNNALYLTTD